MRKIPTFHTSTLPRKALIARINKLPDIRLHILLTDEDNVVVARCLDFSVASHGDNEQDALLALSDSIKDYLEHALSINSMENIIDPDDKIYWSMYRQFELYEQKEILKENVDRLMVVKALASYGGYYS